MIIKKREKKEIPDIQNVSLDFSFSGDNNSLNKRYISSISSPTDMIYPQGIDAKTSPNYIVIDGTYTAFLMAENYPYSIRANYLDELVNFGEGVELFIYEEPQNKEEIVRDITQHLGYTRVKRADNASQVDSDITENAYNHSLYMKRQLADGDEFYYFSMIIRINADSSEALEEKIREVGAKLAGMEIFYKRANFRHIETFLHALPFGMRDKKIAAHTERNILSSGLKAMYPFTSSMLADPDGVFIGVNSHNNSQVILDNFASGKYENANMMIFGSSGSGKTYTTQIIASRFRMKRIPIMMICPLKGFEYEPLCNAVGGNFIRFIKGGEAKLNPLDVRPDKNIGSNGSYLAAKISKLKTTLSLMIPTLSDEELERLEKPIEECYAKKGITFDNSSVYEAQSGISFTPKLKQMPILSELAEEILKYPDFAKYKDSFYPYLEGSLSFLNGYTNIDVKNLYTVADISEAEEKKMPLLFYIIMELYWDRTRENLSEKKMIIIDELWKLLSTAGNEKLAEFVLEIFKIIRGYGGGVMGVTQDWADVMALRNGFFANGISNNSAIKIILKNQQQSAKQIREMLGLSDAEQEEILKFERGNGLVLTGRNHVSVQFRTFETEHKLITTDRKDRENEERKEA